MIQQVIVVEGRSDVAAIRRSVEADCLITGGFSLTPQLLQQIEAAYQRRGIIILTDPDSAGERKTTSPSTSRSATIGRIARSS